MPIYCGDGSTQGVTIGGTNEQKIKMGSGSDYLLHKRVGGVALNASTNVFDHFEGWACFVGYSSTGGWGGTVIAGEDRTDLDIVYSGASSGMSVSKSGGQAALAVNAGSSGYIVNCSFTCFRMGF